MLAPTISFPGDFDSNYQIILRFLHFIFGITWVGLLYFFNLVNVPFLKELDGATKPKVIPPLMTRALFFFRWGAVATVFVGFLFWSHIAAADAHNARLGDFPNASIGMSQGSFTLIWTLVWGLIYLAMRVGKVNNGYVLAVITAVVVGLGCYAFLALNSHGWESSRQLAIGLGGGMGWVMMLNVWGVIWRVNKKIIGWNQALAANGTPIPAESAALARLGFLCSRTNFYLSFPMLFLMAAASHYQMFGK